MLTPDEIIQAQAHVVGLLNEIEYVLGKLGEDKDEVAKLVSPLYLICDRDPKAAK